MTIPKARAPKRSRRAWPVWRSRPLPRQVVISDEPPLAQITVYPDACLLTRRDSAGIWRSYPIDPAALTQALSTLPSSSGLLPIGTIATGMKSGTPFFVQYVGRRITPITIDEGSKATRYHVPLPGLIWAGCDTQYRVFAVDTTTIGMQTLLLHAPLPNVYGNGSICWGTARPVAATAATMPTMLKLFLEEAAFNAHLAGAKSRKHSQNVLTQLRALAKANATDYPLEDLLPTNTTLGHVVSGRVFGGS